jgi:hypothetical protein
LFHFLEKEGIRVKDKRSLHLKVQELVDCYATTDLLKEMSELERDEDKDEAALKWLALATLHGITANAKKISIRQSKEGKVQVQAEYRKSELPSPGMPIGGNIIEAVRAITHLEGDKGKTPLAIGVRDGSIEITVNLKREEDGESVTLKFPE